MTRRCQDTTTAFHHNGDVVMVDYHGQWRDLPSGSRLQNGGFDYWGCEIERIARVDPDHNIVWEIRPTSSWTDYGIAREDKIAGMVALSSGHTLITTSARMKDPSGERFDRERRRYATVILLNTKGESVWRTRNDKPLQFSWAQPFVGDNGEIFVGYLLTNYAYSGGEFQLPGGRVWRPKKNQSITLIARLDPKDGRLIWEKEGSGLVSAHDGELLTLRGMYRKEKTRFEIGRVSYDGRPISRSFTPWLSRESWVSAERFSGKLALTTKVEILKTKGHGYERFGRLRIFDLDGASLAVRKVSAGSKLARLSDGAPLRVLSPTNCLVGVDRNPVCQTDAIEVLTLETATGKGTHSQIRASSGRFDWQELGGFSLPEGMWLHAVSYDDRGAAESTTALFSPEDTRECVRSPEVYVRKPAPNPPRKQISQSLF